ncbi:hypothetical protein CWIS_13975 [Cellulomonas sp. A375-1]|nr:hypothetical protein CWIS_13975 [Cellulomonas sp. A375-1]
MKYSATAAAFSSVAGPSRAAGGVGATVTSASAAVGVGDGSGVGLGVAVTCGVDDAVTAGGEVGPAPPLPEQAASARPIPTTAAAASARVVPP